jgi:hypothetical protein
MHLKHYVVTTIHIISIGCMLVTWVCWGIILYTAGGSMDKDVINGFDDYGEFKIEVLAYIFGSFSIATSGILIFKKHNIR